jgi:hypothetical protein
VFSTAMSSGNRQTRALSRFDAREARSPPRRQKDRWDSDRLCHGNERGGEWAQSDLMLLRRRLAIAPPLRL